MLVTSPRTFILNTREEEKELGTAGGKMAPGRACWIFGTNLLSFHHRPTNFQRPSNMQNPELNTKRCRPRSFIVTFMTVFVKTILGLLLFKTAKLFLCDH